MSGSGVTSPTSDSPTSDSARVALVQGGSRGIGLAFVEALLERPDVDRVIATSRAPDESSGLALLRGTWRDALLTIPLDVRDEASIEAAAERVSSASGPKLHWLINCSGVLHDERGLAPEKKLADVDPDMLRRSFEVNAFGPLLVVKHFASFLCHDERAVVANLSARVGSIGDNRLGGWYGYRASKAAQNMFTRTVAIELGRRAKNVVVLALHPGTVDTDLSRPFQRGVPEDRLFEPERAARQLLAVIDDREPADSGGFFAWDGEPVDW